MAEPYKAPPLPFLSQRPIEHRIQTEPSNTGLNETKDEILKDISIIFQSRSKENAISSAIEELTLTLSSLCFDSFYREDPRQLIHKLAEIPLSFPSLEDSSISCIAAFAFQSEPFVRALLDCNFLRMAYSSLSSICKSPLYENLIEALARICTIGKPERDAVLEKFSVHSLLMRILLYSEDERLIPLSHLIASITKFPLEDSEISDSYKAFIFVLSNNFNEALRYICVGVFRLLSFERSAPSDSSELELIKSLLKRFRIDPVADEFLCYITGLMSSIPGFLPLIDIGILENQLSSPTAQVVYAASWALGYIAETQQSPVSGFDADHIISSLIQTADNAAFKEKKEIFQAFLSMLRQIPNVRLASVFLTGAIETLVEILRTNEAELILKALRVLGDGFYSCESSAICSECIGRFRYYGGFDALNEITQDSSMPPDVTETAAAAVKRMSINPI